MNQTKSTELQSGFSPTSFQWDGAPGFVDRVEGQPLPVVRIFGWLAADTMPRVALETSHGRTLPANTVARQPRPDVRAAKIFQSAFSGFIAEFLMEDGEQPATFLIGDTKMGLGTLEGFSIVRPHYDGLFTQTRVLQRRHIYGSGPPTDVAGELKDFALLADGEILDFGCGNGDLLDHLRTHGRSVVGVELDEDRIRAALDPAAIQWVTLYDGGRPLPFGDCRFDSIVSTEVIEHIPDIAEFVSEFSRILVDGGKLLITTPDITSIPSSFPTGTVPWHLLELTHVNFFTPKSVQGLFESHFELESIYSLCPNRVSGFFVPGSLGAVFRKRG